MCSSFETNFHILKFGKFPKHGKFYELQCKPATNNVHPWDGAQIPYWEHPKSPIFQLKEFRSIPDCNLARAIYSSITSQWLYLN